jgi:hypothetical protein
MRFGPTGFWGVDGVDGVVRGEEDPPPEQALRATARTARQAIRTVQGGKCALYPEAGDGNIEL